MFPYILFSWMVGIIDNGCTSFKVCNNLMSYYCIFNLPSVKCFIRFTFWGIQIPSPLDQKSTYKGCHTTAYANFCRYHHTYFWWIFRSFVHLSKIWKEDLTHLTLSISMACLPTIHLYLNMQYNQFEGTIHPIIVHHEHIPYRGVIFQFQHVGNLKKKKNKLNILI